MIDKFLPKSQTTFKVNITTTASVTDFQYNHHGSLLAVSDSDGNIFIYQRQGKNQLTLITTLQSNNAPIWTVAWADSDYGNIIGIGTFNRKVGVFQLINSELAQIAYHQLHEGSINHVQWTSSAFGLKLYSGGSDGGVAILQLKKNSWTSSIFYAHQCPIYSLSLRPIPLNQSELRSQRYPMIATGAKDGSVKIWKHTSQIPEEQLEQNARIYQEVISYRPHQLSVRQVIWKIQWSEVFPDQYKMITCSEDGFVKIANFKENKLDKSKIICNFQSPIYRISQSITGNKISVSIGGDQINYLYEQIQDQQQWKLIEQLK